MISSSQFGGSSGKRKASSISTRPSKKSKTSRTFTKLDKLRSRDSKAYGLFKFSGEGPFPQKLATTLLYRSIPISATGSAGTGTYNLTVALNSPFDFDISNVLGNKQAMFWDTLMTATGPYQQYECKSWRTIVTVINLGAEAVSVYWNGRGSLNSISEDDTLLEVTNRPYQQQRHLAPKGGTNDRCIFKTSGKWTDNSSDQDTNAAAYNSAPAKIVYGNLFFNTPTTTTAPTVVIQIDHYFDILCDKVDARDS
jgi:hypothetical protein